MMSLETVANIVNGRKISFFDQIIEILEYLNVLSSHPHLDISDEVNVCILEKKNTEIFPCGAVLLYVLDVAFIEALILQETSSALKNLSLRACLQDYIASSIFSRSIIHLCSMRIRII